MDTQASLPDRLQGLPVHPPAARIMGPVNWIGFWTLFMKEVRRFMKVYSQTVIAPVITTQLFYLVFTLAMGNGAGAGPRMVGGAPFFSFLAPGLVMMAMTQNAFANTSSSVMIAKMQGNIVDVLMTPISPLELALAWTAGGIVRGLTVGLVTAIAMDLILPVRIFNLGVVLLFGVLATMLLSLLGVIGAIWANKFDHIAAVTNFIITPLTFLSGTFYSLERFPPALQTLSRYNPFFYMVDGFRYGFIGHAETSLGLGIAILVGLNALLWAVTLRLLIKGYKLKS